MAVAELVFLKAFLANPLRVAAPLPSGPRLAAAVAAEVDAGASGPVLELGPGSGPVTRALLAHGVAAADLTAIERDADFCDHLRANFPGIAIVEGDAFDFHRLVAPASQRAIVSGLPVLGLAPAAQQRLVTDAMAALMPGRPFIQFTYSGRPPLAAPEGVVVRRAATVWANLPPLHVWRYSRGG